MPISLATFTSELKSRALADVVHDRVFEGDPFVFLPEPGQYDVLVRHLSRGLKISDDAITIVGSAKTGFSLDPNSYGRAFSAESDVDVVVISEAHFDTAWQALNQWRYGRPNKLRGSERGWGAARREDVFWGWFTPDKIRYSGLSFPEALTPIRDLSSLWFNAFRTTALYPGLQGRDYNGRLYRTWEHATLYHSHGLQTILSQLKTSEAAV